MKSKHSIKIQHLCYWNCVRL